MVASKKVKKGSASYERKEKGYEQTLRQRKKKATEEEPEVSDFSDAEEPEVTVPEGKKNYPYAAKCRFVQRLMMIGVLALILAREDFATAYGSKSGINRVHVTPLSVLSCGVQNDPHVTANYKLKLASWKALRTLAVPGEFLNEMQLTSESKRKKKKSKKKKETEKFTSDLDKYMSHAGKFVDGAKTDRGLVKLTKQNYALLAGALLMTLGSIFGILLPDYGAITVACGFVAFCMGIQSQKGANPQFTDLCFNVGVAYALLYFITDHMKGYIPRSRKKKAKKEDPDDEWNDGFGGQNNCKSSGGCCG